ncbi:C40 family peptidase [[Kitasatospora] papulosa]|uniref:C40 family peptidase n=1 Tax=[Kitasatospora] papulosa TaxID=1464011 RepID=UPI0036A45620
MHTPARTAKASAAKLTTVLILLATLIGTAVATRSSSAPLPPTEAVSRSAPASVVVQRGDTLWELARRHKTTVTALQKTNHLGRSTLIFAGHRLRLPSGRATALPRAGKGAERGDTRAGSARTTSPGRAAVAFARAQLGVPYRWGGTGRGGYDCSGLVQAAWRSAGVALPRTTYAQVRAGTRIHRAALRPGDLVFTHRLGHVQLYAGGGRVIEAPRPGAVIRYAPLPPTTDVTAYVRPSRR